MLAFCKVASLWSLFAWSMGLGTVLVENPVRVPPAPMTSPWSPEGRVMPTTTSLCVHYDSNTVRQNDAPIFFFITHI